MVLPLKTQVHWSRKDPTWTHSNPEEEVTVFTSADRTHAWDRKQRVFKLSLEWWLGEEQTDKGRWWRGAGRRVLFRQHVQTQEAVRENGIFWKLPYIGSTITWGNRTWTKEMAEHPFTDLNNHKSAQQYKHKHPSK